MAVTPTITYPTSSPGFSTNLINQTLKGNADTTSVKIYVNDSLDNVTYVSGNIDWEFTTMLSEGDNTFSVKALDAYGSYSSSSSIKITLTLNKNLNLIVSPPTAISLERSKNSVKITVIKNPESYILGYNFYGSEIVGGGSDGFSLLNNILVNEPDYYKEVPTIISETKSVSGDMRITSTVEQVNKSYYYSYIHNRINQSLGTNPTTEPNHYVVTAIGFDDTLQEMVESNFSAELGASPLLLDTTIRDLTIRKSSDIQESYIDSILNTHQEVDVKPGTITRDVHINPPSDEFERIYIIQDFMHRCQSFLTLLSFDDPEETGTSADVLTTPNKRRLKEALLLQDNQANSVQTLIDDAFTKLAGNVNVFRKSSQQALGQALFYTRSTPTRTIKISSGSVIATLPDENNVSIRFETLASFELKIEDLPNYYNSTTNRYEKTLDIKASETGESGNVDAAKIVLTVSGVDAIFAVTNPNKTEFGQDVESNSNLAQRAILAFASVDSGTEAGYLATTLSTPNVTKVRIVSAGEKLMQRDLDYTAYEHFFGKVDIYVQGSQSKEFSDVFGFTFKISKKEIAIIQSVSLMQFKSTNTNINISIPIYTVLEVKNVTRSANYNLTNFIISGDGNVIDLDENLIDNMYIGLGSYDVIQITYRYRDSEPYVFNNQPVNSIIGISGELSGSLTEANYTLRKLDDPLIFGYSTIAQDSIYINYANGLPTGELHSISNEEHTIIGTTPIELLLYGVISDSIIITDYSGTIVYQKDSDYTIIEGSAKTKTGIKRIDTGTIPSGLILLISYEAGENFTVTYSVNYLLQIIQSKINEKKHLTADVVVKSSLQTFIDAELIVFLEEGSDQISIDRQIRTEISKTFNKKEIGESVYQSDIDSSIRKITGVSYVEIPFKKMTRHDNSIVIREHSLNLWIAYQTNIVTSYISVEALEWNTTETGGPNNYFKGVYENDIPMEMVLTASEVATKKGRAYIDSQGFLIVSPITSITNSAYTVTYVVSSAYGSNNITLSEIEYPSVGDLVITYDYVKKFKGF